MLAALYVPDFPLQALRCFDDGVLAAAVLEVEHVGGKERARVAVRTAAAAALGVELGMVAAQAQARCPRIALHYRDAEAEARAQAALLACANDFSPDFEDTAPGCVTLDLVGVRGLGDLAEAEAFGEEIAQALREASGLRARVGMAGNADLALLAARLAEESALALPADPEGARALLAPLPAGVLDPGADLRGVLALWGIRTVGELAALPRDAVAARLGREAAALWDRAAGGKPRLLRLARAPDSFAQRIELDYGAESLEPLLFLLRRMAETVAARLAAAYLNAGELAVMVEFERPAPPLERRLRLPDPSADPALFFRVIHAALEGLGAPAPAVCVALEALPARPAHSQFDLFQPSLRDPARFAETLAQLEAMLGADRVGRPEIPPSHRPGAFVLRPLEDAEAAPKRPPTPGAAGRRDLGPGHRVQLGVPLRRFRPPLPARVVCGQDGAPAEVTIAAGEGGSGSPGGAPRERRVIRAAGPWRLSGHWWERAAAWAVEEWDAELSSGRLCRLSHDRIAKRWLLEGIYG
ncbi:MAG: hypothetical protein R3F11_32775 [Verrucomicrobiales bacterium]